MEEDLLPRQTFKHLFWFQKDNIKYGCAKVEGDDVYRIREMVTCDPLSACWTFRREVYMSVEKYSLFVRQHDTEISTTRMF